jgi:hypothetical protein
MGQKRRRLHDNPLTACSFLDVVSRRELGGRSSRRTLAYSHRAPGARESGDQHRFITQHISVGTSQNASPNSSNHHLTHSHLGSCKQQYAQWSAHGQQVWAAARLGMVPKHKRSARREPRQFMNIPAGCIMAGSAHPCPRRPPAAHPHRMPAPRTCCAPTLRTASSERVRLLSQKD